MYQSKGARPKRYDINPADNPILDMIISIKRAQARCGYLSWLTTRSSVSVFSQRKLLFVESARLKYIRILECRENFQFARCPRARERERALSIVLAIDRYIRSW